MGQPRKLNTDQEAAVLAAYSAGMSGNTLSAIYSVSARTIYDTLRRNGNAPRPNWKLSEKVRKSITQRYQRGDSAASIGAEFDVSDSTIYRHLEGKGIGRRTNSQAQRRYSLNEAYFAVIDTEEKAYWLGFLAADGCVKDCGDLSAPLAESDRAHVERLALALGSDRPIPSEEHNGRPMAHFVVRSHSLCSDLIGHGVTPRKTHTLVWPDLPGVWMRHFVRGYVDGDGGFYYRQTKYPCGHHSFSVTGNTEFICNLQSYLMSRCGLRRTKLTYRRKGSRTATLTYGGRQQVSRIARLLYINATIYLTRKRKPMADLITISGVLSSHTHCPTADRPVRSVPPRPSS